MAKQVSYKDKYGNSQSGWYSGGHVYQDQDLTTPIDVGSSYTDETGRTWKMTDTGGKLWSTQQQTGSWNPQNNQWYSAASDVLGQIQNRQPFQFDLNNNPLYNQYKDKYTMLGQQAMQDTMGKAAGLTGGYGSSYGQSVGQQTYNNYLSQLNDIVPELYSQELTNYNNQTSDLYNLYSTLMSQYSKDYDVYSDEQSNALSMVSTLLSNGITPSAELMAKAGISEQDASALSGIVGGTTGSESTGTGSTTSNGTGKTKAQESHSLRPHNVSDEEEANYHFVSGIGDNYHSFGGYQEPEETEEETTAASTGTGSNTNSSVGSGNGNGGGKTKRSSTENYNDLASSASKVTKSNRNTLAERIRDAYIAGSITKAQRDSLFDAIGLDENMNWQW